MRKDDLLYWLLDVGDPSLRLRVLKEINGYADDAPEVRQARSEIPQSRVVQSILEKMHPDGYWLQKTYDGKIVGDGVIYGSFATTHFCLAYLAELGVDRSTPQVERAAERYLSLQQPDGDWLDRLSCLIGYNIRTFTLLGYRDDQRVRRSLDLLLNTVRHDGGYLCDFHERRKKSRPEKSCIRGSIKALAAFSEFPETWNHPRVLQLLEYFLNRGGIFKSRHPGVPVNQDIERLSFPITWRTSSWEILYALSKMGYGKDERLISAWIYLDGLADPDGRYHLHQTPAQSPWKMGQPGQPNPWITFYVEAAKAYRDRTPAPQPT